MRIETVNAKGEKIVVCESGAADGPFYCQVRNEETGITYGARGTPKGAMIEAIALSPFNPENR